MATSLPLLLIVTVTLLVTISTQNYSVNKKCSGSSPLTDTERADVLKAYNQMRSDVSSGGWMTIGGMTLPKARNMQVLTWDCNLENLANEAVANCPSAVTPDPSFGQAFTYSFDAAYRTVTDALHPRNALSQSAQPGFNEANSTLQSNGNPNLQSFSNIIRANTTKVGCSSATCASGDKNSSTSICFFNSPDIGNGDVLYDVGTPCITDGDCTASPFEVCIARSMCYTNPIARRALDLHNEFRSAIALGKAQNELNVTFPMAAAMNRLEYLLSLEKVAQEQAEKWAAATADAPPPIAGPAAWNWMNLAVFNTTAAEDELKATEKAVKSWWDLRNKIDRDVMTALLDNRNVSNPATEFVELTRGNYTHVGCAVAGNELNYNVVCAYKLRGPPGEGYYITGEPCSLCVYSSCDPIDGLCVPNEVLTAF